MTTQISIFDDKTQSIASVSNNGELIVSPISYSTAYYMQVTAISTPVEIVPAVSGKRFVVTSLLLASDKNYASSTVAETLTLYEASPADLATSLKTFTQIDLLRNDRLVATALNLVTSDAISLVAVATSNNVDVTIAGYYVKALGSD